MKILVKGALGFLGFVVLAAGGFATFVAVRGVPQYEPGTVALKIDVTAARVQRGRDLSNMLCAECHRNPTTQKLTGRAMLDLPPEFGQAFSLNITQDPTNGIGAWTDGELVYLLRTGIKRDGHYAPPWMVKMPHASDEDIYSIVAYLRSNEPEVQPEPVDDHPSQPSFLAKLLVNTVFKPLPYPTAPIVAPDKSDQVAYGKYLATGILDCYPCHSADFKTMNIEEPEKSEGFFGGGNLLLDINGKKIYSANITPDETTGIGSWTEEQFHRALTQGFAPGNRPIRPPMLNYRELSQEDTAAIFAYLKTVPKIVKANKRSDDYVVSANASDGEKVYLKYSCQLCHGLDGLGVCDLRDAHAKYSTDEEIVQWIRDPSKLVPGSRMPTWEGVIQSNEYGSLAAYVRELGKNKQP